MHWSSACIQTQYRHKVMYHLESACMDAWPALFGVSLVFNLWRAAARLPACLPACACMYGNNAWMHPGMLVHSPRKRLLTPWPDPER